MSEETIYDIIIIGGGPTGLFGAYYAGMRSMKTLIIESLPDLGGQLTALYPEKYIYDVAGFPAVLSKDLARNCVEQAMQYKPDVRLQERAQKLEPMGEQSFRVVTDRGSYEGKTVLVAAGLGFFKPNKLDKPGMAELEDRGVYYFIKDREDFRDRDLLVVGGGDSAMDWVLNLHSIARNITLVHRRDLFRAHEDSVNKVFNLGLDIYLFWEIEEVRGQDWLEEVVIRNSKTEERKVLEADALLVNIGFKADRSTLKQWNLEMTSSKVKVNEIMQTSIKGVYAAGDVASHTGSMMLIATGFAEAAVAVNNAKASIDPSAKVFPGHSSEMTPTKLVQAPANVWK